MCDTIAALGMATATGSVLFGKNSDRDHLEAQYLEAVPAREHGPGAGVALTYLTIEQVRRTNAILISKPHWIWGAEMGANEHDLVIGNEAIFSHIPASIEPRLIGMDYVRLALERAASVDEGIEVITTLLRKHGQGGNCGFRRPMAYDNSFLLADRNCAKVLETVDREWVVRPVVDFWAISNAMTIETDFQASSATLMARAVAAGFAAKEEGMSFRAAFEDESRTVGGRHRRARAMTLLAARAGLLAPGDFFRVLRDHEEGPSVNGMPGARICAHRKENPIGQTTASWVSDLRPGPAIHWVTGTAAACTGLLKPLLLKDVVPAHGPRPGDQEDQASLWWSHERLRRGFERVGTDAVAQFTRERDRLEDSFLERTTAVRSASGERELESLVPQCWLEGLVFEARWHKTLAERK